MDFDIGSILKFSFLGWIKEKWVAKYVIALFLLSSVAGYYAILGMKDSFAPLINAGEGVSVELMIGLFSSYFVSVMALSFVIGIITSVINYLLTAKALKMKKLGSVKISLVQWLRYLFSGIVVSFAALFSIYNLKMLWVAIAGVVLFIFSLVLFTVGSIMGGLGSLILILILIIGLISLILSLILFVVYFVVVAYNSIRFSFTSIAIVQNGKGFGESLKASWDATNGKVLSVFLALLVVVIIVMILSWVSSIFTMAYSQYAFAGVENNSAQAFEMLASPGYLISMIPSILVGAYSTIAMIFAETAIFATLMAKKETFKPKKTKKK